MIEATRATRGLAASDTPSAPAAHDDHVNGDWSVQAIVAMVLMMGGMD